MSKIVCDVCGTTYPESASQCPICGCVHSVAPKVMRTESEQQPFTPRPGYTPVKGGRFSKANVKKRNKARKAELGTQEAENLIDEPEVNEKKQTDKGLLVAFIVLLLSIAAVVCYILIRFLGSGGDDAGAKKPDPAVTTSPTTVQTDGQIACQDITLGQGEFVLTETGATVTIDVTLTPADATQELAFASSDENVATVDQTGVVTAVGAGEAVITITCGDVEKTCSVTCSFGEEFALKVTEFTFFAKDETCVLYEGEIPVSEIVWTSSDEKVATVLNGKVTAVSAGEAVITAQYNGTTRECVIHCSESVVDNVPLTGNFTLNKTDVSIKVGETFVLKLRDEQKNVIEGCTFESDSKSKCTVTETGTVKGVGSGKATITVTYGDQTYTCIVRVK